MTPNRDRENVIARAGGQEPSHTHRQRLIVLSVIQIQISVLYSKFRLEWQWEWTISSDSMHVCLHQLHPIRSTQGRRGLCPEWSRAASGGPYLCYATQMMPQNINIGRTSDTKSRKERKTDRQTDND